MNIRGTIAASAIALTVLGVSAASATTVYTNDFSVNAAGFTGANLVQTSPDGTTFLGFLTQGAEADLNLSGLAAHNKVTLSFDMYAINSLDGDGSSGFGPDYFTVNAGSTVLLNDTFSSGWSGPGTPTQSYGGPGLSGTYPATTGSVSYDPNDLGYTCYYGCENTYKFSFTFNNSASAIAFNFIGNTTQPWNDEAFGIDNVVVSTSAVPEPATWAMMLIGFGAIGFAMRRPLRKLAIPFS